MLTTQDNISLYQQVREDYTRLFPSQRAILALVYLYERFGSTHVGGQVFTDGDLTEAMHRVANDEPGVEGSASRLPQQQWRHLQQYLLERDRDDRTYRFTVFGLTLCQALQKVFTEQINPTQVAHTFITLRRTLEDGDLLHWVQTVLPELRGVIQQHVEILADNLRIELRKLRWRTDHDDEALELLVKRVSQALAELSQQAAELRAAFGQANGLEAELERRWQSQNGLNAEAEAQLRAGVSQARDFLAHTNQRLRSLERRLSLVQPRIRDLFGNLRKLQFDRNSERLLWAFLRLDVPSGSWPLGLQPKSPGPPTQHYCLLGGRSERALPPQPAPARTRPKLPEAEAAFGYQTQALWDAQQRVGYWVQELAQQVEATGEEGYAFIELARQIGQVEGAQSFDLLARLLAQLRRHIAPRRGWKLQPDPTIEELLPTPEYNILLWKLRIYPAPKS